MMEAGKVGIVLNGRTEGDRRRIAQCTLQPVAMLVAH